MRLSAPTLPVFIISVVIAALVIAVKCFGVAGIPWVPGHLLETLLIAYAVLLAGNLFRGL